MVLMLTTTSVNHVIHTVKNVTDHPTKNVNIVTTDIGYNQTPKLVAHLVQLLDFITDQPETVQLVTKHV